MSNTLITVLGTLFGIVITGLVSIAVARMSHRATKEGSALDGFDKLSTRLANRLETVENRIGAAEDKAREAEQTAKNLQTQVTETEERANAAETTANELKGRVVELEKREARHIRTIRRLRNYITYLTEQIGEHAPEAQIKPLEDEVPEDE